MESNVENTMSTPENNVQPETEATTALTAANEARSDRFGNRPGSEFMRTDTLYQPESSVRNSQNGSSAGAVRGPKKIYGPYPSKQQKKQPGFMQAHTAKKRAERVASNTASSRQIHFRGRVLVRRIIYVSGDPNKLEEFKLIMGPDFPIPIEVQNIDLPETQCASPEKVAREKCRDACRTLQPRLSDVVICEDTSLCFNALNGLPGSYVKWFLMVGGPEGLSKMIEGFHNHSAYAQCIFALYGPAPVRKYPDSRGGLYSLPDFPDDSPTMTRGCDECRERNYNDADRYIRFFTGRCDGNIVKPRGEHAFGWDSCFEPLLDAEKQQQDHRVVRKTYAEMSSEEKNACSHRARAFEKLKEFLTKNYYSKK